MKVFVRALAVQQVQWAVAGLLGLWGQCAEEQVAQEQVELEMGEG